MKVLLTHERFPPDWGGGGETIVYETARGLLARGVEVQVVTTGDPSVLEYDGIPTERMAIRRYEMNFASRRLARWAAWADLIQTFNYHACRASLLAGQRASKPVVCGVLGLFGDSWLELKGRALGPVFQALERHLLRLPFSKLCFLSDFSMRAALELGVAAEKACVVRPGIQSALFRPEDPKEPVVLFAGKFSRRKGVYEVLQAARALPAYRFELIGWGPEEDALRALAPPNARIQRGEPGQPPASAYAKARVFLFPSQAETLGLVIPEAMASGCAVVSCVPVDFHGARFEHGDTSAMIEGIRDLMENDARWRDCSRANVAASRAFQWGQSVSELIEVYRSVMRTPAAQGVNG